MASTVTVITLLPLRCLVTVWSGVLGPRSGRLPTAERDHCDGGSANAVGAGDGCLRAALVKRRVDVRALRRRQSAMARLDGAVDAVSPVLRVPADVEVGRFDARL